MILVVCCLFVTEILINNHSSYCMYDRARLLSCNGYVIVCLWVHKGLFTRYVAGPRAVTVN